MIFTINIIGCQIGAVVAVDEARLTAAASAGGAKKREDWCLNKPINGKFVLAGDCGVHKISGQCESNDVEQETAVVATSGFGVLHPRPPVRRNMLYLH